MHKTLLSAAAGIALLASAPIAAQAYTTPLMLLDMMVEHSQKEALAVPAHGEWCASSRPGYRKQWNNWRNADGRVTYCSSPYYTVPWKRFGK
jgi:hypothetical protein